jgi:hypothetical protein
MYEDEKKDSEMPGNEIVDDEKRLASVQPSQEGASKLVLDSDYSSKNGGSFAFMKTKMSDDDTKDSEEPGNEIVDEEERLASVQTSQIAAANLVLDSSDSSCNIGGSFNFGSTDASLADGAVSLAEKSFLSSETSEGDKKPKAVDIGSTDVSLDLSADKSILSSETSEGDKKPKAVDRAAPISEDVWDKSNHNASASVNMAGIEREKRLAVRRTRRDAKNSGSDSEGGLPGSNRSIKVGSNRSINSSFSKRDKRGAMNSDNPSKGAWMGSNRSINSSSHKKEALKPAKLTLPASSKKDGKALSLIDEKKDRKTNWRDDEYALGVDDCASTPVGPGAVRVGEHRESAPESDLESKRFSQKSASGAHGSKHIEHHVAIEDGEVVNAAIIDEEALQRDFEVRMRADMVQASEVEDYEEPGFCQRNACKIGCASLFIIVGLAVGLGVGLSNSSGTEIVQNITNVTNAPTPSPTLLGDYEYLEFLFSTISGDKVFDETTPQAQALESIYNESQSGVYDVRDLSEQYLDERYALRVLYYSTQGDGWGFADNNFTSTLPTCSWMNATSGNMLSCNEKEEVTDLFLNSVNLNGTIPSELGVLSSLSQLSLANNLLYGKSVSMHRHLPRK